MTGRDWIIYILKNNLEDEPLFKDGKLIGFIKASEFAERWDVGVETVRLWVTLEYVDGLFIYDELYIPHNAEIREITSINRKGVR